MLHCVNIMHALRGGTGICVGSYTELRNLLLHFFHTLHIQMASILGPLPRKLGFLLEFCQAYHGTFPLDLVALGVK